MDKKQVLKEVKRHSFMVLACLFYAFALEAFLIPSNIIAGGVSGAASIIHIKTGLPTGLFMLILNAPILICAFKTMGWKFILRCFITTATLSLCAELIGFLLDLTDGVVGDGFKGVTDNYILASLYGGVVQGIGIGLFIKYEMSSGGTELLGRLTHKLLPMFSIAFHAAFFDAIVVVLGAILISGLDNILYALIIIFVSATVSDIVILGLNKAKLCYVITSKADEIGEFLIKHNPRGITRLDGVGMYTKQPKGILMTCVKSNQVVKLREYIKELDENAFVIITEANEVYGKGFHRI